MADQDPPQTPEGISEAAREAAEHAAATAGIPLGQWISQAIANAGPPAEGGAREGGGGLSAQAQEAARRASESADLSVSDWIGQANVSAGDTEGAWGADDGGHDLLAEARAAALDGAAASGMSVGAWISQAIVSAGAEPAPPEPDSLEPVPPEPVPAAPAPAAPAPASREDIDDVRRWARRVPIDALREGPFQTRAAIEGEDIEILSQSIRDKGVLQPILVRRHADLADRYEIIAGERRWRAAKKAPLSEVPVIILDLTDRDAMEVALVENLLRRDLNPLEEADGYHRLIGDFSHTQEDLARVVGRSRSHVANTLRLLRLPAAVQAMLREGELTAGHARALLNAEDSAGIAHQVRAQGLNVRQTEELVQLSHAGRSKAAPVEEKDEDLQAMEQQISDYLGMKVRINMRGDRGTLNIKFRGFASLGNLLSRLQRQS
jgi:ParB family chromosome partitioning protein